MNKQLAPCGSLVLLLISSTTTTAFAEQVQTEPLTNPWFCASNATNPPDQHMKVCVSKGGSVSHFESPKDYQHIGPEEGYAVCYTGPAGNTVAYDKNNAFNFPTQQPASAGWNAPVLSGSGCNRTVTRTTTDGYLQWKQSFSCDFLEKELTIKVELKNLKAFPVNVQGFARFVLFALDNSIGGDIADKSADSVSARQGNSSFRSAGPNALALTGLTDIPTTDLQPGFIIAFDRCTEPSWGGLLVGNWLGRVFIPVGTLGAGKVEGATFVYRRY